MPLRLHNKGYTIPEMLVYIAVLSAMLAVIINVFIFITSSYRAIRVDREIEISATSALERIVREARDAASVGAGSVLGSHPGTLVLSSGAAGAEVTVYVEDGAVMIRNGSDPGVRLTTSAARVTNLSFQEFSSPVSTGVRVTLTLEGRDSKVIKSETFYATAMLRGSY